MNEIQQTQNLNALKSNSPYFYNYITLFYLQQLSLFPSTGKIRKIKFGRYVGTIASWSTAPATLEEGLDSYEYVGNPLSDTPQRKPKMIPRWISLRLRVTVEQTNKKRVCHNSGRNVFNNALNVGITHEPPYIELPKKKKK